MPFEAVDIRADERSRARWEASGSPKVPAIEVSGDVTSVLHPAQVASLVGVPGPPALESTRLSWDLASVLEAWITEIRAASWDLLTTPTPSRGRTLRNLTVNVFLPIRLLPGALATGDFPWNPEEDDPVVEATLTTPADVVGYAEAVSQEWSFALLDLEERLVEDDPEISSPRGALPFTTLLASQRWHAAYHFRQLTSFYEQQGVGRAGTFSNASLRDLDLPADVF